MTNEEIQKLLGGYATNSLTDVERKALFEAALEDQELFNLLEREQALKDVLDDPISRRQVREALEATPARSPAWWARWWSWGVALSAVAAVAFVVYLSRPDHDGMKRQSFDIAMAPKSVPPVDAQPGPPQAELKAPESRATQKLFDPKLAPRSRLAKDAEVHQEKEASPKEVATAPPPPPAVAAPSPVQEPPAPQQSVSQSLALGQAGAITDQAQATPSNTRSGFRDQPGGQRVATASRPAFAASYGGFGGAAKAPPLTYFILKRDEKGTYSPVTPSAPLHQGDVVRINVLPSAAGYLTLYERESGGGLKRLFPLSGTGIKVLPNTTYTLPDSPIDVKEEEQLRLVLSPEPAIPTESAKTKAVEIQPQRADKSTPVVVDITLGSKKE